MDNTGRRDNAIGLPADAERRQIVVLFADLIDSSHLARTLDPEDFGNLIVAYREAATQVIQKYGGFVAHYVGDGTVAYWGYPRAREQDPRRAVSAGLAIVGAVGELNQARLFGDVQLGVRVGVDAGIVVIGHLGPSPAGAADVAGEAPVIAARLQQAAAPNTVLISENIHRMIEQWFEFGPLEALSLKGISPSIRVCRALAECAKPSRLRANTDQIQGREVERASLVHCWHESVLNRGQALLIIGEPGIGKSALVAHLCRTVTDGGGACLEVGCIEEGMHSPLLPVRDLLRRMIGATSDDGIPDVRTKIAVAAQRDGLGREEVDRYLLPLVDPTAQRPTVASLSERHQRGTALLAKWLECWADSTPLVVVIEDIHWADTSSLEFFESLTARVALSRLLLVLTSRPLDDAAGTHLARVPKMDLRRLDGETIASLVAHMDPHHFIDASTRDAVAIRAEGNPLFAEQLVLLTLRAQGEQCSGDALTLPSSLNELLLARLDRLGALRPVAQAAAVIGREFDCRILAEILGIPSAELSTSLAALVTSGILDPTSDEAREVQTFRHSLIRDAAYHSLLKGRRAAIHKKAAAVLVSNYAFAAESHPELVAQHYEQAGQLTEAIHWWTKAGEQASRQSTTADSIRLLERARALCGRLQDDAAGVRKAEVLNLLGVQYIAAHGYASSMVDQTFTDAVALLEGYEQARPASLLFALWGLHVHSMVRADVPRALGIGERILSLAAVSNDDGMTLQGHRLQGLASLLTGAHRDAAHHYGQVLQRYDQVNCKDHRFRYGGDPKVLVLAQLAWSEWICGKIEQSEEHARHAIDLARAMEHSHSLVYAVGVNALRLATARDFNRAAAMTAEAGELADRFGFSYWGAWCGVLEAALELSKDPERACQLLTAAVKRYQGTGARQLIPFARSIEAECWLNMGRPREARAVVDAAMLLVEETGVRIYQAELLRMRACASYQLAESTVDEDLAAAIAVARHQGARSFVVRSLAVGTESG